MVNRTSGDFNTAEVLQEVPCAVMLTYNCFSPIQSDVFVFYIVTTPFIPLFVSLSTSAPSEVTFAIDVGNGPILLVVQSPSPLNDNQWHHVWAERGLKKASLQVDNLPRSSRETTEDGHFQPQLNSQLLVGRRQLKAPIVQVTVQDHSVGVKKTPSYFRPGE